MNSPNEHDDQNRGDVRRADPDRAATDREAAAKQEQVKADHDALEDSARRVDASVSSDVRNTPIRQSNASDTSTTADAPRRGLEHAATDRDNAAKQEQVKADHDALQASARRVEASVPADVRDTPVQPADRNDARNDR